MERPSLDTLRALFAEDAVHVADGGGVATATLRPLRGAARLALLYRQIAENMRPAGPRYAFAALNGEPALLVFVGDRLVTAMWIEVDGDRIAAVHALRHPGKLARLQAVTESPAPTSLH